MSILKDAIITKGSHSFVFENERAIRFQFVDRRHILKAGVNTTHS